MIKNETEIAKNVKADLAARETAKDAMMAQYPAGTILVGSPVGDVEIIGHDGRQFRVTFPGVDPSTEYMAAADIDDYVKQGILKIK